MDELYSCRNCIHNAGQSLHIGSGDGYCLRHDSILSLPDRTTCKYLHRKDLPFFVVDEGLREHAGEFAGFPALADLHESKAVPRIHYSERYRWERQSFDPLLHALAQYPKVQAQRSWVFVQTMSGGLDGSRATAHASLVRRYMDQCGSWTSSYRLILALVQELDVEPQFRQRDLCLAESDAVDEVRMEARWDVFFTRLAGLQEYGFHAGMELLMWATDHLNGALSSLDWTALLRVLPARRVEWTQAIIQHAMEQGESFSHADLEEAESVRD